MRSAFIFLRRFKLAHVCIQVTNLHTGEEFESNSKVLNRKAMSRNTTHRQSYNLEVGLTNDDA